MLSILIPVVLIVGVTILPVVFIQLIATALRRPVAVGVIGVAAVLFVVWQYFDLRRTCNQEPKFIAPSPEDEAAGAIGTMVHACDGPSGAAIYGFLQYGAPVAIGLIVAVTLVLRRRAAKTENAATGRR